MAQTQSTASMSPTEPIVDSPVASQNKSVVQMSLTSSHIEQVEELELDSDTTPFGSNPSPRGEGRHAATTLAESTPVEGESSPLVSNVNNVSSEKQLHIILYYNARSVLSKMDELHATMLTQHPHIVCMVEIWLSSDISDNKLQISDYQHVRLETRLEAGIVVEF